MGISNLICGEGEWVFRAEGIKRNEYLYKSHNISPKFSFECLLETTFSVDGLSLLEYSVPTKDSQFDEFASSGSQPFDRPQSPCRYVSRTRVRPSNQFCRSPSVLNQVKDGEDEFEDHEPIDVDR